VAVERGLIVTDFDEHASLIQAVLEAQGWVISVKLCIFDPFNLYSLGL
jgi:hypothetical protein